MNMGIRRFGMAFMTIVAATIDTAACSQDGGNVQSSSATHFLQDCPQSCGDGLQCVCGICTLSCVTTSDCETITPGASCMTTAAAQPGCGASGPPQMCDFACGSDADCAMFSGAGQCIGGHCRTPSVDSAISDAGNDTATATDAGNGCLYGGVVYPVGSAYPDLDGCNTCYCQRDGISSCTLIGCSQDAGTQTDVGSGCVYGGVVHAVGSSYPDLDGCNQCFCQADGTSQCTVMFCG